MIRSVVSPFLRGMNVVLFGAMIGFCPLLPDPAQGSDIKSLCAGLAHGGKFAACFGPVPVYDITAWEVQDPKSYEGDYFVNTGPTVIEKVEVRHVKDKVKVTIDYLPVDAIAPIPAESAQRKKMSRDGVLVGNRFELDGLVIRFVIWHTENKAGTPWPMKGLVVEGNSSIWSEPLFVRRF